MDVKVMERLSKCSDLRAVDRLQNGQIELCWDYLVIRMRTTDLVVLNDALNGWMESPAREWAQTYSILLNDYTIFIVDDELHRFCSMINDAVERLANRTVRWADLDVRVVPHTTVHQTTIPSIYPN